ncbi:MAG: hypothetical protein ACFFED_18385, partial [Candidatus Thorarchaeota archaeon]
FEKFTLLSETIEYPYATRYEWWEEMLAYGWKAQIDELCIAKNVPIAKVKDMAFDRIDENCSENGVRLPRRILFILADK